MSENKEIKEVKNILATQEEIQKALKLVNSLSRNEQTAFNKSVDKKEKEKVVFLKDEQNVNIALHMKTMSELFKTKECLKELCTISSVDNVTTINVNSDILEKFREVLKRELK